MATSQDHHTVTGSPTTRTKSGRGFTIGGAVCAVIALVFFPIVFGPVGAVLGFVGYSKGDKPAGMYVGIGAIVCMVIGMVIGVAIMSNS